MNAILVEVESFEVWKLTCRAVAGLTMAFFAKGCSAEVENANERPPNRWEESGEETAVVTPDRWAKLDVS
jgi:hypothetical protein